MLPHGCLPEEKKPTKTDIQGQVQNTAEVHIIQKDKKQRQEENKDNLFTCLSYVFSLTPISWINIKFLTPKKNYKKSKENKDR